MIYLDTSVLVAYYVPEPLSQQAQQRLLSATTVTISDLVQTEFVAALSLRQRIGDISLADIQQIATLFFKHVDDGLYHSLPLHSSTFRLARDYIARFDLPLKAPDALHLAAASLAQLTLATADRQLARNAQSLGITVDLLAAS